MRRATVSVQGPGRRVSARGVAQFVFKIFPLIVLFWLRHVSTLQNPADGEAAGAERRREAGKGAATGM